ncbi:MAG TPA: ADP-glyceromanno-heptose 6-epimerase, partial [Chitinophagaceae bacterium]
MASTSAIVLTGAAGFIGSYVLGYLNRKGITNILIVDDFSEDEKKPNYEGKQYIARVEREQLFEWLKDAKPEVEFFCHLGARTDTTEFDYSIHQRLNVEYSKHVWEFCTGHSVPLVYASSAATYGGGEWGYREDTDMLPKLSPLNPYGVSKNEFDKWAIAQEQAPPFWAGLKFFNVYGPNEYHKARMASVVLHAFNQISSTGRVKLFRSHRKDIGDGEQSRDFIHVEDVTEIIFWMYQCVGNRASTGRHSPPSGIYNVGTGQARTFGDLAHAIFHSLGRPVDIEFIDTPEDIRDKYQ